MSAIDDVIAQVLAVYGGWGRDTTAVEMRADWDRLFSGATMEASVRPDRIGGVPALWIAAPNASDQRIFLYLHGGGYQIGSPRSHTNMVAHISEASEATALVIDYRLAPEHRFPAPIEDVLAICAGLQDRGMDLSTLGMVGDSAGGNLALASLLALRERGMPLPAALALLSPWTDMRVQGESYETRAAADPIHQRKMLVNLARSYLGDADPASPLASPIDADLRGFPPMLIHVGDREVLLSDAERLADRARNAGVDVAFTAWQDMIHVFQQFPADLPEARKAIEEIGAFLSAALGNK